MQVIIVVALLFHTAKVIDCANDLCGCRGDLADHFLVFVQDSLRFVTSAIVSLLPQFVRSS
jgi:hypothetical protein